MKKLLFAVLIAALACSCSNNSTVKYTIKGDLPDLLDGSIYLADSDGNPIDSTTTSGGKFIIKGETDIESGAYLLQYPTFMTLIMLENGTINVSGSLDTPIISGTPANDGYHNMVNKLNEFQQNIPDKDADSLQMAIMTQAFKENSDNIFGVYLMQNMMFSWSAEQLIEAYNSMPKRFQEKEEMIQMKERADQMLATEIGKKYIDIDMNTSEGTTQKLSSFVEAGNYVLLDFWASWCSPCMNEVPYLIEAYSKYHDNGFEIYGVSLDADAASWVNAIAENNMNWIHVSDIKYWDCAAAKEYGVVSIPANYLIAPDGTIVARNLRGEELDGKLAELLK